MDDRSQKVISGVGWSSLSSGISYILLLLRTFILVRILAPEDFGLMALSLLLVTTLKQFSSLGLEQALIQTKALRQETVNTVWFVSVIRGLIFFLLINLISPIYADFFQNSELVQILFVISFAPIFFGLKNSYISVSERELRFDTLFKVNVISQLTEFLVTIYLAITYKDVMALAVGYLAGSITSFLLSFIVLDKRPKLAFDFEEFKNLFGFGKWVLGGGLLIFLILNIDTTLIGKLLGVYLLGMYNIAFRFANFAATDIVLNFSRSIYPSFSLVKDDVIKLKDYFFTTYQVISLTILPLMLLFFCYAESFVLLFLGTEWLEAILPLKILIIFGTLRSFASNCGFIFWAIGKPEIQTKISLFQLIVLSLVIYPLVMFWGISGAAIAVTGALLLSSLASFYMAFSFIKAESQDFKAYFSYIGVSLIILILISTTTLKYLGQPDTVFEFITLIFSSYSIFISTALFLDYRGNKKIKGILENVRSFFMKSKIHE